LPARQQQRADRSNNSVLAMASQVLFSLLEVEDKNTYQKQLREDLTRLGNMQALIQREDVCAV